MKKVKTGLKKAAKKQKGNGTAPLSQYVERYKEAEEKAAAYLRALLVLKNEPTVAEYLKAQEAAKQPSAEEKKQKDLLHMYDEYSMNMTKAQNKLWILSELAFAPHDCDIPLENLYHTITEIDEHVQAVEEKAARAFGLLGVGDNKSVQKEMVAA